MGNIACFDFSGQVAIVTGGGCGIGFGIATALADSGAHVILNDADADRAGRAVAKLPGAAKHHAIPGDVGTRETIVALKECALREFGRVDLAVANAGITTVGDFKTFERETFDRLLRTNLGGSFFLAQMAAELMIQQQSGGSILLLSSVLGHRACVGHTAYAMTKAALEMMARSLVLELSGHGITINAVAPGATLTERTEMDPDYNRKWCGVTPMRRPATPGDIASTALFLLSKEARHITGQSVIVDGGWSACSPLPGEWP